MKKLYVVTVLMGALLFASRTASAQTPCTAVCQAYYPCDYSCDLCVGDPGLWEEGGGCWGEIVSGTCGDIGQCGVEPPCQPNWIYDQISYQGARPEFTYEPRCDWEWDHHSQSYQYVCDYSKPYKCTVYGVSKYVRRQNNCPSLPSSQTFCGWSSQQYVDHYQWPWQDWDCCYDSNTWNCTTAPFPECPGF